MKSKFNSDEIISKNLIPVIIRIETKLSKKTDLNSSIKVGIDKRTTYGGLLMLLRGKFKLKSSESLFMFLNNSLVNCSHLIVLDYEKYKNNKNILILDLCTENTFGWK